MPMNFIQISLYNISTMQAILYQFDRDVAAEKGLGCPQRKQANLVANSGNALHGVQTI